MESNQRPRACRRTQICRGSVLAVLLALTLCAGCTSLPLAVQLAALVGSGASYLATGKTLTDHAVSTALDRDCRLLRALNGNQICEPSTQILFADALPVGDEPESLEPPVVTAFAPGRYAVIGSFRVAENAARWAQQHQALAARVYPYATQQRTLFRVVVGPLVPESPLDERLAGAGITAPWRITL